jgi:hypothetical protein
MQHALPGIMTTSRIVWIVALCAGCVSSCGPMTVGGYRVHPVAVRRGGFESYPHVTYEDREAYLLGSEWYYRDPSYGMVVFDQEPPELRAFRERTIALEAHPTH